MAEKKTAAKKTKHEDYVFPEVLGNDWHRMQPRLRLQVKLLEDTIYLKGVRGDPGDYVFQASDGGVGLLTEEELNEHYENCPPAGGAGV